MSLDTINSPWAARALGLLRIVTAWLFLQHGTAKLFGVPMAMGGPHELQLFSLIGLAAVLEAFGGVLVLIGLFTRPVAFVLSGEMAVAYFKAHASMATVFTPLLNHGESAIMFCFVFLLLAAAGSGAWSVDAFRAAKANRT